MLYPLRVPGWFQKLYPSFKWSEQSAMQGIDKPIYLTFDDGPHPQVTMQVLEWLRRHHVKATFFCVGNNVEQYPEVYKAIQAAGHSTGNHTQHHVSGWSTPRKAYLQNIAACAQRVRSPLFRPPYGKITPALARNLKSDYTLVMWSLLSGDFSPKLNTNKALNQLVAQTKPGDIVVFHDSLKAQKNLYAMLPLYLEFLIQDGYTPLPLPM